MPKNPHPPRYEKVGRVPTCVVQELLNSAKAEWEGSESGFDIRTTLVADNHRHTDIYTCTDAAYWFFRGWRAGRSGLTG